MLLLRSACLSLTLTTGVLVAGDYDALLSLSLDPFLEPG
jgi:hypothetical protein